MPSIAWRREGPVSPAPRLDRLAAQRLREIELNDGAAGPEVLLASRILEAMRTFPFIDRAESY